MRPSHAVLAAVLAALVLPPAAHAAGPLCRGNAPGLFSVRVPRSRAGHRPMPARPVEVGQERSFWVWDFSVMPPGFRTVTATCRAAGERGLVYVENTEWGTHFTEADLSAVTERFERSTPGSSLDPSRGISDIVSRTFAPPPLGLDGDPRVVLLFTAMASFNGSSFDGYFNACDTLTDAEAMSQYQQHSNACEILYLNTRGSPVSSDYMLGVISHELSHLVCHPFDGEEASWLDESLGEAAMVACGYPVDVQHLAAFARKPETPLITDGYVSYGACFLFGTYLLEQLGPGAVGAIVRDPSHGVAGLEATLAAADRGPFARFYRDWASANLFAHASPADPKLAYRAFPVPELALRTAPGLPAEDAGELAPHRVRYLKLPAVAARVTLSLEPSTAAARLLAARWSPGEAALVDLLEASGSAAIAPAPGELALILLGGEKAGYRLHLEDGQARAR